MNKTYTMDDRQRERYAAHMAEAAGPDHPTRGAAIALRRLEDVADRRAREWVRANNSRAYADSPAHERRWARIERERDDVEFEMHFFYGTTVTWPGLYPVVTCPDGYSIYF